MGCQKEIAQQIRSQKGNYVLGLKGNPLSLPTDMQAVFESGMETNFTGLKHSVHSSSETAHGRVEERTCHVIKIAKDHPQRAAWTDLRTLAVTISRRVIGGRETWKSRFSVSSHPPQAAFLAPAIRRHWSIENSRHWVLDVVFGEVTTSGFTMKLFGSWTGPQTKSVRFGAYS